jgi:hypothetical protein
MATMGWEELRGIEAGPIQSYDFPHPINETIFLEHGVGDSQSGFRGRTPNSFRFNFFQNSLLRWMSKTGNRHWPI